jgi:uncharacterized protein
VNDREDARAVVRELLARIAAGTPQEVAGLYADDVDWELDWPQDARAAAVPWIRPRRTRVEVAEHYTALARHLRPAEGGTTIDRVLVDGEDAVVTGVLRHEVRSTGRRFTARFALHLRVRDGRIVQHHVYEDSLSVHGAVV